MENKNVKKETKKDSKVVKKDVVVETKNSKKILPIVFISIILLALIAFGVYKLVSSNKPNNVYYAMIDRFAESMKKAIDNGEINQTKENAELKFNINSSDSSIKEIAKILNNMTLKVNAEGDIAKKYLNFGINAIYNNDKLFNGNFYIINDEIFMESSDFLDKAIRLASTSELATIWNSNNKEEYKNIINEMANVLKGSLKKEYFKITEETIKINGKDVIVKNEAIILSGKDLKQISIDFIENFKNNKKLIGYMSNMTNLSESEIKKSLEESKKSAMKNEVDSNIKLEINTYINKETDKFEGLKIKSAEYIEIRKIADTTFDIIVSNNNGELKVGTIELTDNLFDISFDIEEVKMNYRIAKRSDKSYDMVLSLSSDEFNMNINIIKEDNKTDGSFKVDAGKDSYELLIKMETETNAKVQVKKITDYVDLNTISEDDAMKMMENLSKNQNLMKFIEDINPTTTTTQMY